VEEKDREKRAMSCRRALRDTGGRGKLKGDRTEPLSGGAGPGARKGRVYRITSKDRRRSTKGGVGGLLSQGERAGTKTIATARVEGLREHDRSSDFYSLVSKKRMNPLLFLKKNVSAKRGP